MEECKKGEMNENKRENELERVIIYVYTIYTQCDWILNSIESEWQFG